MPPVSDAAQDASSNLQIGARQVGTSVVRSVGNTISSTVSDTLRSFVPQDGLLGRAFNDASEIAERIRQVKQVQAAARAAYYVAQLSGRALVWLFGGGWAAALAIGLVVVIVLFVFVPKIMADSGLNPGEAARYYGPGCLGSEVLGSGENTVSCVTRQAIESAVEKRLQAVGLD